MLTPSETRSREARERPIIFSAPMVRAILAGRKTQTRRIVTRLKRFGAVTEFGPSDTRGYDWHFRDRRKLWNDLRDAEMRKCLPYAVGDRLWVREAWRTTYGLDWHDESRGRPLRPSEFDPATTPIEYLADETHELGGANRSPLFMPRWATRLTLEVTEVRVERLQDISHEDAAAEELIAERTPAAGILRNVATDECKPIVRTQWQGAPDLPLRGMERAAYRDLWNSIHGKDAWDANPWVAALTFRPLPASLESQKEGAAV